MPDLTVTCREIWHFSLSGARLCGAPILLSGPSSSGKKRRPIPRRRSIAGRWELSDEADAEGQGPHCDGLAG